MTDPLAIDSLLGSTKPTGTSAAALSIDDLLPPIKDDSEHTKDLSSLSLTQRLLIAPGAAEGVVKGGLGFAVGGSYAALRATTEALLSGDPDQYAATFNSVMEDVNKWELPFTDDLHVFQADSDAGKITQQTIGEWFRKGSDFFDKWATEGQEADIAAGNKIGIDPVSSVPSAVGRRLLGEAAMLMAPIFGAKGVGATGKALKGKPVVEGDVPPSTELPDFKFPNAPKTKTAPDGTIEYVPEGKFYKELIRSVRDEHPGLSHQTIKATWNFIQNNYARIRKEPVFNPEDSIPFSLEILPYEMYRSVHGRTKSKGTPLREGDIQKKYIKYIDDIENNYINGGNRSPLAEQLRRVDPRGIYNPSLPKRYLPDFDTAMQKWVRLQEMALVAKEIKKNPNIDLTNRNQTATDFTGVYKENITEGAMRTFDAATESLTKELEAVYAKDPSALEFTRFPELEGTVGRSVPSRAIAPRTSDLDLVRSLGKGATGLLKLEPTVRANLKETGMLGLYKRMAANRMEPETFKKGANIASGEKPVTIKQDPKTGVSLVDRAKRPFIEAFLEFTLGRATDMLYPKNKVNQTTAGKIFADRVYPPTLENGPMLPGETSYPVLRSYNLGKFSTALNKIFHSHLPRVLPYLKNTNLPFSRKGTVIGGENNTRLLHELFGKPLSGTKTTIKDLAGNIRTLLDEVHDYAAKVLGTKFEKNYFPIEWQFKKVIKNKEAFYEEVLRDQGWTVDEAYEFVDNIANNKGMYKFNPKRPRDMEHYKAVARGDTSWANKETHMDFHRKLKDFDYTKAIEGGWINTNVKKVLDNYIESTVSRVEFARQFGANLEKAHGLVRDMVNERFTKVMEDRALPKDKQKGAEVVHMYEIKRIYDLLDGIQGLYGKDHPWNNVFGVVAAQKIGITTLNWGLLPLATLSSLPEMALPMHRAGVGAYGKALGVTGANLILNFTRTIYRDAFKNLTETRQTELLNAIGKGLDAGFAERTNSMFAGDFTAAGNVLFTLNGQHFWIKTMNSLAVSSFDYMVKDYLTTRSKGTANPHMEDLMKHYGLDVNEGMRWVKEGAKLNDPFAESFKQGAFKFVEENVLTPNPANLPMWHSNPVWSIFRHLKTFPTMMANTVLRGWVDSVAQEFTQNRYLAGVNQTRSVLQTGAYMLSLALISNLLKDLIKYGDTQSNPVINRLSDDKKLKEYLYRAADGSMIIGPGNSLFDAWVYSGVSGFTASVMGPTTSKLEAATKALSSGNARTVAREMAKTIPAVAQNKYLRDSVTEELAGWLDAFTWLEKKSETGERRERQERK